MPFLKNPLKDNKKSTLASPYTSKTKELARVANTQTGICPICGQAMDVVMVSDKKIPCYVCLKDRICTPVADDQVI
jgi:hypothetical protein